MQRYGSVTLAPALPADTTSPYDFTHLTRRCILAWSVAASVRPFSVDHDIVDQPSPGSFLAPPSIIQRLMIRQAGHAVTPTLALDFEVITLDSLPASKWTAGLEDASSARLTLTPGSMVASHSIGHAACCSSGPKQMMQ